MPTNHPRIAVVKDKELAAALDSVAALTADAPAARVVHDLAVKGAEAMLAEQERHDQGIERLIAWWEAGMPGLDLDVLEHVEELAWGE